MSAENIIDRQYRIANGEEGAMSIKKFSTYAICNLRGGIGKTTLAFNLSYLADNILAVDTCPQGNLSFFFNNQFYSSKQTTVLDMILPYLIPGLGKASHVATFVGASNPYFNDKNVYNIPSSAELYLLPSQLITAISQASGLSSPTREQSLKSILLSLKTEIKRELKERTLKRCIIDTSPFFSGATQLSWYAADALIIPVRTDQQSINSFELLLNTLTAPQGEFRKYMSDYPFSSPKVHMVVLTHCGWSTTQGARNEPNQQTKVYLHKIYDIMSRHRALLSSDNPDNHLLMLDDFLGTGRISSVVAKPIDLLQAGEMKTIERVRCCVNRSVDKCKNQLRYICNQIF